MRREAESHGPSATSSTPRTTSITSSGTTGSAAPARSSTTRRCGTSSWTRTPPSTRSPTRSRPSRPTTPTARRSCPIAPSTTRRCRADGCVHRRPHPARRRPHLPPAPHARAHARPARGVRARGASRLHRGHDLLRVPDLAHDLERRPVARGARADPRIAGRRPPGPGPRPRPDLAYVETQRSVLLQWKAAVADAVARGWSREETIARVRFDDVFGPVDVGQAYMMDHIQNNNAGSLWDKLTALGYAKGRYLGSRTRLKGSTHPRGRRRRSASPPEDQRTGTGSPSLTSRTARSPRGRPARRRLFVWPRRQCRPQRDRAGAP